MTTLFNSAILPIYNYGIELYGNTTDYLLNQIQIKQNRLLKIIYHKPQRYSSLQLHSEAKILKIRDIHRCRLLLQIHKIRNDNIPHEFQNRIHYVRDTHNYPTRTSNQIYLQSQAYHNINKIFERASIEWNKLPADLHNISDRVSFKNKLHDFFMSAYNNT